MDKWQDETPHAQRMLAEPCPFCGWATAELWYDPTVCAGDLPYQVRCRCGARGPRCDCGEESAVPNWLSVAPVSGEGE